MSDEWNTYRTRFLVRAKQLREALLIVDGLGRAQNGRPGDYLVQSSEGLFHIARREVFEDVYVLMEHEPSTPHASASRFPRERSIAQVATELTRNAPGRLL